MHKFIKLKQSGIILDGSNIAWHGREGLGPDTLRLINVYKLLSYGYGFEKILIVIGRGLRKDATKKAYGETIDWFKLESEILNRQILYVIGGDEDLSIIDYSKQNGYFIITNDNFENHFLNENVRDKFLKNKVVNYAFEGSKIRLILSNVPVK